MIGKEKTCYSCEKQFIIFTDIYQYRISIQSSKNYGVVWFCCDSCMQEHIKAKELANKIKKIEIAISKISNDNLNEFSESVESLCSNLYICYNKNLENLGTLYNAKIQNKKEILKNLERILNYIKEQ